MVKQTLRRQSNNLIPRKPNLKIKFKSSSQRLKPSRRETRKEGKLRLRREKPKSNFSNIKKVICPSSLSRLLIRPNHEIPCNRFLTESSLNKMSQILIT